MFVLSNFAPLVLGSGGVMLCSRLEGNLGLINQVQQCAVYAGSLFGRCATVSRIAQGPRESGAPRRALGKKSDRTT